MNFEAKRDAALRLLAATGMRRNSYLPPIVRLLWLLQIKVPPPHFVSFAANFVVAGIAFSAGWGLLMWIAVWSHQPVQPHAAFGAAAAAGIVFGLCIAAYYRYGARKHRIPLWDEFEPAPSDQPA
jgi:Family of unknown function (DUF6404)